jgi:DNA-binding NtrC family response regulator
MSDIRKRILIVDDDPQIVSGLSALLSEDWDVRTADTGRAALVIFSEFSPDVVLLDVQLPDFSGIDLLHQFKMYSETAAVIMMSGMGTLDRVVESMKLGAETFLQKPFDAETLIAVLEQVERMIGSRRELYALRRGEGKQVERLPGLSPSIVQLNDVLGQIARAPSRAPRRTSVTMRVDPLVAHSCRFSRSGPANDHCRCVTRPESAQGDTRCRTRAYAADA